MVDLPPPQEFEVPAHSRMLVSVPGQRPGTMLTIEAQLFNVVIREYTGPLSWQRQWCYPSAILAAQALLAWITQGGDSPTGWIRAIDGEEIRGHKKAG